MDHDIRFPDFSDWGNKLKIHVQKHQRIYCFGAGITLAGFTCFIMKGRVATLALRGVDGLETADTLVTNRPFTFLSPASHQTINTITIKQELGRPPYLIHDVTDDLWYKSQTAVAKALDASNSTVSRHLRGILDHVSGHQLERVEFSQ